MTGQARVFICESNAFLLEGLKKAVIDGGFDLGGCLEVDELPGDGGGVALVGVEHIDPSASDDATGFPYRRVIAVDPLPRDATRVMAAVTAGLGGYFSTDMKSTLLPGVISLVDAGERYFPMDAIAPFYAETMGVCNTEAAFKGLSPKERDIFRCVASGDPNKVIARKLGITEATVKVHMRSMFRKMGVANRTQAAIIAVRMGVQGLQEAPMTNVA